MKPADTSSFLRQIITYGLGIVLNYGLGMILLPIYSRLMPVDAYGVLSLINQNTSVVSVLLLAQIGIAYIRIFRDKSDQRYQGQVTTTTLLYASTIAVVVMIGFFLFDKQISSLVFENTKYAYHIRLSGVRFLANVAFIVPFLYFQATEQPTKYIVVSFTRFAVLLGATIAALYMFDDKIAGVLWAQLSVGILFTLVVGTYVLIKSSLSISFETAKEILKFSWSLAVVGVYGYIIKNGDRYVISRSCGQTDVGLYDAGYRISLLLNTLIFSSVIRAWQAKMVDVLRSKNGTRYLARLTTLSTLLYTAAALALSVYCRELVGVFLDTQYQESYRIVPLILLAYGFDGIQMLFDTGIYYSKKTYLKLWHGITAAACVGLYLWLIPQYCMMGAAWATVGTYFIFVVITWVLSQRELKVSYEFGKLTRILLLAAAVYLVNYFLEGYQDSHYLYLRVAGELAFPVIYLAVVFILKLPLLLLFAVMVLGSRILEPDDEERIRRYYEDFKEKIPFLNRGQTRPVMEPQDNEMS